MYRFFSFTIFANIYIINPTIISLLSAAWLLPTDYSYGDWPTSGEIDMVEIHGNDKFICDGIDKGNKAANSTLHWAATPGSNQDKYFKTRWNK